MKWKSWAGLGMALGGVLGLIWGGLCCRHTWGMAGERDPSTGLHRLYVKCLICGRESRGVRWEGRER